MQTVHQHSVQELQASQGAIAIAATFTAEPLEDSLRFWMQELKIPLEIEFAPYNQIFQQLLDPGSVLAQNKQGINVVLVRFEDWLRFTGDAPGPIAEVLQRNMQDLVGMLKTAVSRSSIPYLICRCPDAPARAADPDWAALSDRLEAEMQAELSGMSGLYWLTSRDLARYPVGEFYDPQRDKLGHIPFTPLFFTALGTAIARKTYTLKSAPHKVIVLDCDNTIWKGVVGEDGVTGIEIPPGWRALQEAMVAQQQAGMLIALCSKNNEPDVMEVFEQRSEMPLKLEHLVAWRINWVPKSENIKSLAQELNLGLDSFIFIDDNPMECAEVQANCPDVLTLQLPIHADIPTFLDHVWALDHLKVTEEDKQRTAMYKQNLERDRFQREATTIGDFLAGLELNIQIAPPTPDQLPRVSQLTQRTNQFNFSTVRRSDTEIQQLAQAGLECRCVEVSDRFGDYGLVGVMIFAIEETAIRIDTFLLSCRVLGRGVEHRMLNHLGELATERNLPQVIAPYIPSKKNLPARNFLESVAAEFKQPTDAGANFVIPAEVAAAVSVEVGQADESVASETPAKSPTNTAPAAIAFSKSEVLGRIATELTQPEPIFHSILHTQQHSARPQLAQDFVAPRNATEERLAALWAELLHLDRVGVQDNYFDLGGTSLLAVEVVAQIEKLFDRKLPLTTLVEAPTVEKLARRLTQTDAGDALVLLREGGSQAPVFLIHDGDGETMLYRNLAYRLKPTHAVYGLQPLSQPGQPILHSRIPEMAMFYRQKIQSVQPAGPYLLGGMCAGGVLAFEVARQLQAQGEEVALVALMDAADVEAPKQVGRVSNIRLQRFSNALGTDTRQSALQRGLHIVQTIARKATNLLVYEVRSRLERTWHKLQIRLFRYYLDRKKPLPSFVRGLSVRRVYEFAEQDYRPQGKYNGEVTLFRATSGVDSDEPYVEVYADPLLGWGQRVTRGVQVYDVPGGHSSMLQEPNVQVMAEQMQSYIDAALARTAPIIHRS